MMRTGLSILSALMLLTSSTAEAVTHDFATERLTKIGKALPETTVRLIPQNDADTVIMTPTGRLRAHVADGKVDFLGIAVFDVSGLPQHVTRRLAFIERLALENKLFSKETRSLLKTSDIEFENTTLDEISSIARDLITDINLRDIDQKRCRVSWRDKDGTEAAVIFPNYHDLISGLSMSENEQLLEQKLTSRRDTVMTAPHVDPASLKRPWPPTRLIETGDTLHSRHLSSDRYYEPKIRNGMARLICSSRFPVESMANMFTTALIANDVILDIKMKCYGYADRTFNMPLNAFVSYFIENGCRMYFGLQSIDEEEAVFTLIAYNRPEGYCHTMTVRAPLGIVSTRRGNASVRMNNYIPTSKIDRLYDEENNR